MSPIFLIVYLVSIILFSMSCYESLGIIRYGQPDNRFDRMGERLRNMLSYGFGQKAVLREPYGALHMMLFWSFLVFIAADLETVLMGVFPAFTGISAKVPALSAIFDDMPALTLLAVAIGIIRGIFFRPRDITKRSNDVLKMLAVIAVLVIAFFGLRASLIASGRVTGGLMPVSGMLAGFLSGLGAGKIALIGDICLFIPAGALLFFAAYVPHNRHMHMLTAIPNSFFRSLDKPTAVPAEEYKPGNTFGIGKVTGFSWKDLLDTYTCTECGRCEKVCPAANTGKELTPKRLISSIQENLFANAENIKMGECPSVPLIGSGAASVSESALWSCTTCGGCYSQCPVSIEHLPKIIKMRRHLVETEAKFPEELLNLFENMEQRSNPWGIAPSERTKWSSNIEVKPFEAGKTEYLYFVGCAGAFDSRARQVTIAFSKVLDAAGVSWGVLGAQEKCCGDSMRRLGNEYVFDQIASENKKMFEEKGVRKIVTHCAHCFNTLKNDYGLEVVHHSQFISSLISEGRLNLKGGQDAGKTVFHDPCYLGRHNEVYDAPRTIIAKVEGKGPGEMPRTREKSFCCGAGGGRMWMEEYDGTRINRARVKEALGENPSIISVACPYCLVMFEDGLKDEGAFNKVSVKDIAEVVAERL